MGGTSWNLIIVHVHLAKLTCCRGICVWCSFIVLLVMMSVQDRDLLPDLPEDPSHSGLSQETVDAMVKKSLET